MAGSKRITTSLQYSNGMVRISIESLRLLGNPEYVTIMVNKSCDQLSFLPSAKTDNAALMVKKYADFDTKSAYFLCQLGGKNGIFDPII